MCQLSEEPPWGLPASLPPPSPLSPPPSFSPRDTGDALNGQGKKEKKVWFVTSGRRTCSESVYHVSRLQLPANTERCW